MNIPRHLRALAFVISLLCLGGCGCNLVGCANALLVTLTPAPSMPYSVSLILPGDSLPRVVDCADETRCVGGVFFPNISAVRATVVVTVGDNSFRRDVRPEYSTSRPNGPGCEPVCRQGRVTVALPVVAP